MARERDRTRNQWSSSRERGARYKGGVRKAQLLDDTQRATILTLLGGGCDAG
jgi:hypothetical protein